MDDCRKDFDCCGIGNGLLDICINVSDEELALTELRKGSMTLAPEQSQAALLSRFRGRESAMIGGGSIANSIVALAQLGGRGALLTRAGNDAYGAAYRRDFHSLGITLGDVNGCQGVTGTCLSLLTPDSERTMQTCLGVSADFSPQDIAPSLIERSRWLFVEGYLLLNPGSGVPAVREAISLARKSGTDVALSFSDAWLVEGKIELLRELAQNCSFIFCNEDEARTFTGRGDRESAFESLAATVPGVAMTSGKEGARYSWKGQRGYVPGFESLAVDTTGAGDMFAGAMLYGMCQNIPMEHAVRGACGLAARVVAQPGARLGGDIREYWLQTQRTE